METLTFESVKVREIICLDHWPYKPVRVANKSTSILKGALNHIRLTVDHPVPTGLWMTEKAFNKAGYIRSGYETT